MTNCRWTLGRRGIYSYSKCMWLPTWTAYSRHFFCVWSTGSCDNVGLATCSVFVWWACALWNMGSNVRGRQWDTSLASRNRAALWWLFALPLYEWRTAICQHQRRERAGGGVHVHWWGSGRETETYFGTLCKSCWCQRTICVSDCLQTDTLSAFLLKCQQQAYAIMTMLIILVCGVIKWKANLQASVYSALGVFTKAFSWRVAEFGCSSLSKYQNKSGLICSDVEQVLLSHFLSTLQFHSLPNSRLCPSHNSVLWRWPLLTSVKTYINYCHIIEILVVLPFHIGYCFIVVFGFLFVSMLLLTKHVLL